MKKKILYVKPDGGVAFFTKSPNCNKSLEELVDKVAPKDAISHAIVDESVFPQDKEYRGAWEFDGKKVVHNLDKAKEIHKEKLRFMRNEKMSKLDVEYQRADEKGDQAEKKSIGSKKQKLRDITKNPEISAARSIEELKMAALRDLED